MPDEIVTENPWQTLRRFTSARIGLGRAGDSLPTDAMLAFQLDHARARDAVHLPFKAELIRDHLLANGYAAVLARSAADGRDSYLRRPDLGRRLSDDSRRELAALAGSEPYDAAFVIADGLSSLAVHQHAVNLLGVVLPLLYATGWHVAPLVVASQSRVALADEVGAIIGATQVAILIGERPGLSVADSLGIYLTYGPRVGRTDAERNCISNIHGQGLSYAAAADTLVYLMSQARRLKLTGIDLKNDRNEADALAEPMGN
ncbi:MAG: ethanolamine ammonia-lyase subunit EutC [Oscillochloris sp.]|nr:ethanolamine ammonia-lyase subunit EutC [Oscillochloris sp.]